MIDSHQIFKGAVEISLCNFFILGGRAKSPKTPQLFIPRLLYRRCVIVMSLLGTSSITRFYNNNIYNILKYRDRAARNSLPSLSSTVRRECHRDCRSRLGGRAGLIISLINMQNGAGPKGSCADFFSRRRCVHAFRCTL